MTDVQVIAIVGFFAPLLVAVVKKERFADWVNAVIAIAFYLVLAVLVTIAQAGGLSAFSAEGFFANFGLVFASGTIGYVALWKASVDPVITSTVLP